MEKKQDATIKEINKIIINTLIAERAIHLPRLGSLKVVAREQAKSKGARRFEIEFLGNERGSSLVNIISSLCECTSEQANLLYDKWFSAVYDGETIHIEGLCLIQGKQLRVESAMDSELKNIERNENPNKAKSSKKLFLLAATILLVCGAGAYFYFDLGKSLFPGSNPQIVKAINKSETDSKSKEEVVDDKKIDEQRILEEENLAEAERRQAEAQKLTEAQAAEAEAAKKAEEQKQTLEAEAAKKAEAQKQASNIQTTQNNNGDEAKQKELEAKTEQAKETNKTEAIFKKGSNLSAKSKRAKLASKEELTEIANAALTKSEATPQKKYRVVFGAFSSFEGAGRVWLDLQTLTKSDGADWTLRPHGRTFMISLLESDSYKECKSFMNEGEGSKISEELWIYQQKTPSSKQNESKSDNQQ